MEATKTEKVLRKAGDAVAWPVRKIMGTFTTFVIAIIFLVWLTAFIGEKVTGVETLPEILAPKRLTTRDKLAEDERDCVMYVVLVNTKAAAVKTTQVDRKIIGMVRNHAEVFKSRPCDILHEMRELVAVGDARPGVPNRQDWYLTGEFSLEWKRKRALQDLIDQEQANPDLKWDGTHMIRPDRKRTAGNQTDAEKARLKATLNVIPTKQIQQQDGTFINDPLDAGFVFLMPQTLKK